MSKQFEKLVGLLRELFQLDQPDLDFGIYRIMHAKADELTQFLERDLLPQVKTAFSQYTTADKAELQAALAKAIEQANGLGVDPESTARVKELRQRIGNESVDVAALEIEVYDHLYSFFRRYYQEGDFLAKRVYKPGVYAIPYEGEEVKLHWANRDQYYIKTSEYLRDYAFTLKPGDAKDPMRVHFRLVDAAEGEHGNVKAAEGKDRVFILASDDAIFEEDGELVIRFHYRPATLDDWTPAAREAATAAAGKKPPTQKELSASAVARVLAAKDTKFAKWIAELSKPHTKASGDQADHSRLQGHLSRYTARNTFDYFIHKDLGGFLRRELDFYIKNEVMHLDDVESETAARVEQYLSKIKVIRKIAIKLIDFLAQLEDFQRKLWLKKKFVVETYYCIALGALPHSFYPEIAANEAQRLEWIETCRIDTLTAEMGGPAYSVPLTIEFLQAHPTLLIDTRHYSSEFASKALAHFNDISSLVDGVLIHGDNAQALNLLRARYNASVHCIYIDPPYNTDASSIDYKNGYKSSSWMSLLQDRLQASRSLLTETGVLISAIDDEQHKELGYLLSDAFADRMLGTICVRSNPSGRPTQTGYAVSHEYLLFAGQSAASKIGRLPPTPEQRARFSQVDETGPFEWRNLRREGSDSDREDRRSMYYPIYISGSRARVPKMEWNPETEEWVVLERPDANEITVWPDNEDGVQKRWRWEAATVTASMDQVAVRPDRSGKPYIYVKRRPHEDGVVSVSSWFDAKYSSVEHGTGALKALFGDTTFSYPKSVHAVEDAIYIGGANSPESVVLDYFAGSGTTAQAVISLNRKLGGRRKFILVEVGHHFESVVVPRVKKVAYASQWRDGRPAQLPTANEIKASPRIVKIIRLETYEDTLNNLQPKRSAAQNDLLSGNAGQSAAEFKENYVLRYMLEVETRGSASLLNVSKFDDPLTYHLQVRRPETGHSEATTIDLVETFNLLIGLTVEQIAMPQALSTDFKRDGEGRLQLKSRIKEAKDARWWFRTVTGTTPDGRKTLVIWRKLTGDAEQDNLVLDEWFKKQGYSTKDYEFDVIYVNGDNNLENLRQPDETWKVRLIEEDFHRLMFDTTGL